MCSLRLRAMTLSHQQSCKALCMRFAASWVLSQLTCGIASNICTPASMWSRCKLTLEDSITCTLQCRCALQGCQHIHQAVLSTLAHFRPSVCAVPQQQRERAQCWCPLCGVHCCCDTAQACQSCSQCSGLQRWFGRAYQHLILLVPL